MIPSFQSVILVWNKNHIRKNLNQLAHILAQLAVHSPVVNPAIAYYSYVLKPACRLTKASQRNFKCCSLSFSNTIRPIELQGKDLVSHQDDL